MLKFPDKFIAFQVTCMVGCELCFHESIQLRQMGASLTQVTKKSSLYTCIVFVRMIYFIYILHYDIWYKYISIGPNFSVSSRNWRGWITIQKCKRNDHARQQFVYFSDCLHENLMSQSPRLLWLLVLGTGATVPRCPPIWCRLATHGLQNRGSSSTDG